MRVTFLTPATVHGQTFAAGDASDLPDHLARNAVARGLAVLGDVSVIEPASPPAAIPASEPEPEPESVPAPARRRGRPRAS